MKTDAPTPPPPPAIGVMQFCTESQVLVQQRGINSESKEGILEMLNLHF